MFQPVRFGKYLLIDKIARGGMAEIFLARLHGAQGFEKEFVIKRILPEWSASREFLTMLIDEAKLAALLTHANIVQVHELGVEGEDHYIAMEYVNGVDLRQLWDKRASQERLIPLPVTLYIMTQALEGLSYAHRKKDAEGKSLAIIHRDVSPQNILISFDGAVKLTDFGIAKAALRRTETVSGVHKGKFSYMSPEQANLQELDQQSDIFSAGIVLYEVLTGKRLFSGSSDIATIDRIRRAEVRFSPEDESIPKELREIVLKALARDSRDRFRSAEVFLEKLSSFTQSSGNVIKREGVALFLEETFSEEITHRRRSLGETTSSTRDLVARREKEPSPPLLTRRWTRRAMFGGLAVLLLVIALGGLVFLKKGPPAKGTETQKPPVPSEKALPIATPPDATPDTTPNTAKEAAGPGYLSVMSLPWGYVAIDGGPRRESPIQKQSLKEGRHRVSAYYEPENLTLNAIADVKPGKHVRCIANFESEPVISCR